MSVLVSTPVFSDIDAAGFAAEFFGISGSVTPLPGERDQNFLVTTKNGRSCVLKIANAAEDRSILEAQHQAMDFLGQHLSFCPKTMSAKNGDYLVPVSSEKTGIHLVRLVSYIQGTPMGLVKRRSPELFMDLGRSVAHMDKALAGFSHPAVHRDFHWDLANASGVVNQYITHVTDPRLHDLIQKCTRAFENTTRPLLQSLRKSVIHNDANDYNVLAGGGTDLYSRNQSVTGIIDFGDMVYSHTVCDPAIAAAYAVLDMPDPLQTAARVIKGYHEIYPLEETEISVLFSLICMRLCVSACLAAFQQKQRPDDPYLRISQAPIKKALPILACIDPQFAIVVFRSACGLEPFPKSRQVQTWLAENRHQCFPVMGEPLTQETCTVLDLGVDSPLVSGDPTAMAGDDFVRHLSVRLKETGARYGIGRYKEARVRQASFLQADHVPEKGITPCVHLCMDVVAPKDARVYAPFAGRIHSAAKTGTSVDQGTALVLEHTPGPDIVFYTIFRGLSSRSTACLSSGEKIEKGQAVATIASSTENGGWPPHVRIQVVTGLMGYGSNFPSACRQDQTGVWTQICLDPNVVLQIPDNCFPKPRPNKQETLAARRRCISDNLSIGYHDPVKIVRGWQQHLFDDTGRQFLDAYNNVPHVGHCHPAVIQAGVKQMKCLNTNTRYLHDTIIAYADKLSATMPDPLEVCFFLNSASEANELAVRLAKAHTGQKDFIVLEGAYHGNTNTLIDMSPYKHGGPGGEGAPDWVHTAPVADVYRGPYKKDDPLAGKKYADHVKKIVENLAAEHKKPAGFIAESYPSVGGQIIFPPAYLARVYDHVKAAGGVCIADEVQTGYGRIGTDFYAFLAQNVVPDIVILGKPIGNGHPVAALVTTKEIAQSFVTGMEFFSTFGGNTVSCATGLKVLEITLAENLQENARKVGIHLLARLRSLKKRYKIIGDVRGSGLFIGMELVRNHKTLEPADQEASFVVNRMRDKGILMGTDGPLHNVVKIRPPLVITKQDTDTIADTMEEILAEDFA
jgi:4-aminobutyrate aminotransferase-like enzyme/Ser/Thr protein kinase RdoA (MazF antagonist)